jgi:hypothetical protein
MSSDPVRWEISAVLSVSILSSSNASIPRSQYPLPPSKSDNCPACLRKVSSDHLKNDLAKPSQAKPSQAKHSQRFTRAWSDIPDNAIRYDDLNFKNATNAPPDPKIGGHCLWSCHVRGDNRDHPVNKSLNSRGALPLIGRRSRCANPRKLVNAIVDRGQRVQEWEIGQSLCREPHALQKCVPEIQSVQKPSEHLTIQEELGKLPNSIEFSTKK